MIVALPGPLCIVGDAAIRHEEAGRLPHCLFGKHLGDNGLAFEGTVEVVGPGYVRFTARLVDAGGLSHASRCAIGILLLLFGGGFGYRRYGHRGGIGIGGILLLILVLYLVFGRHAV